MKRQMHIGLFLLATGSHPAGWRHPGAYDSFVDLDAIFAQDKPSARLVTDLPFPAAVDGTAALKN